MAERCRLPSPTHPSLVGGELHLRQDTAENTGDPDIHAPSRGAGISQPTEASGEDLEALHAHPPRAQLLKRRYRLVLSVSSTPGRTWPRAITPGERKAIEQKALNPFPKDLTSFTMLGEIQA